MLVRQQCREGRTGASFYANITYVHTYLAIWKSEVFLAAFGIGQSDQLNTNSGRCIYDYAPVLSLGIHFFARTFRPFFPSLRIKTQTFAVCVCVCARSAVWLTDQRAQLHSESQRNKNALKREWEASGEKEKAAPGKAATVSICLTICTVYL